MDLQSLIVQHPTAATQLILLFHGEYTSASAMLPCAQALAATFPQAMVACIEAPYPGADATTRQWLQPALNAANDEDSWIADVNVALPAFLNTVARWQAQTGVGPQATALVGFGQGATLVLESTQVQSPPASRVVAMAGRFATLPATGRYRGSIHFLHGKSDASVPYEHTIAAAYRVRDLDMDLTAEVLPFLGHELHPDFISIAVERLSNHFSKHLWEEALANPDDAPTQH